VLTLAPAAQTGLFRSVGHMNPHVYRPNEFFAVDWVFEGLVRYDNGQIVPALATSWVAQGNSITFTLRQGVTFHDGTPFDAYAVDANFRNVLAPPLRTSDYHGWYDLVTRVTGWAVLDRYTVRLDLSSPYFNALQELTYIRPIRFLSVASMPPGGNTCAASWGNVTLGNITVVCKGILSPIGTGPLRFAYTKTNQRTLGPTAVSVNNLLPGEMVQEVGFVRNDAYWGTRAAIPAFVVKAYPTSRDIASALANGTLDMAYGSGTMDPRDFLSLTNNASVTTALSPPLITRLLVLNTARTPTTALRVRQAVIHSVDKAAIIAARLFGLESRAGQLHTSV